MLPPALPCCSAPGATVLVLMGNHAALAVAEDSVQKWRGAQVSHKTDQRVALGGADIGIGTPREEKCKTFV